MWDKVVHLKNLSSLANFFLSRDAKSKYFNIFEDKNFKIKEYVNEIICGLFLKDYRFENIRPYLKRTIKFPI